MADTSLIKFYYKQGVYTLNELYYLVEINEITQEEFKEITSLDYEGIKKSRDWD